MFWKSALIPAVWILGGGLLIYVGARILSVGQRATLPRGIACAALLLLSLVPLHLLSLLSGGGEFREMTLLGLGLGAGIWIAWRVIEIVFKVRYPKAIIIWLFFLPAAFAAMGLLSQMAYSWVPHH